MAKVLLAEDDVEYASLVGEWLEMEQHTVEICHDGQTAFELLTRFAFDVVVLDWDMPQLDGLTVCRNARQKGIATPVLMLTGKTSVDDKEAGLDGGADDYLTKPAHPKELAARVRALMRRYGSNKTNELVNGPLRMDLLSHEVFLGEQKITLLPREYALLEFLLRNAGQVFSADDLLDRVWNSEADAGVESVKACVNRIRRKIDSPAAPSLIRNIYSVGYVIDKVTDSKPASAEVQTKK